MPVFLSPGVFGAPWCLQAAWRAESGLKNDELELELIRTRLKHRISRTELIGYVIEYGLHKTFIKHWNDPKHEFTKFEEELARTLYEDEHEPIRC
jgi:hypothetical protein